MQRALPDVGAISKRVLTRGQLLNLPVGLHVNFGGATLKEGSHRIVNGYVYTSSASPRLRVSRIEPGNVVRLGRFGQFTCDATRQKARSRGDAETPRGEKEMTKRPGLPSSPAVDAADWVVTRRSGLHDWAD